MAKSKPEAININTEPQHKIELAPTVPDLTEPETETSKLALTPEPCSDPFDLANLRYDPSTLENTGVQKLLTTIPVKKPKPQTFFRVHPEEEYRLNIALLELEEDGDAYLVNPSVMQVLPDHLTSLVKEATLFTCMSRQGTLFLWPIKAVPAKGRADFAISAREGASHAMKKWVRIAWKRDLGAYEIFEAEKVESCPEPVWPELSFRELMRIAFRDRIITTVNHPVIDDLRWVK